MLDPSRERERESALRVALTKCSGFSNQSRKPIGGGGAAAGGGCTAGGASEVDSEVTSPCWPVLHHQPPRSAERGMEGAEGEEGSVVKIYGG